MRGQRARSARGSAMLPVLLLLMASVTGCDDGGSSGGLTTASPSTSGADPSAATTSPTSPSTTTASDAPGVAPAGGPELVVKTASVHAPEGWRPSGSLIGTDQGALQPSTFNIMGIDDHVNLSGGSSSDLDAIYHAFLGVSKGLKNVTRLPDVSLAGTPALHVRYQDQDRFVVTDMITTVRADRSVTLSFSLEPRTLRQEPELIDSVVASFAWL